MDMHTDQNGKLIVIGGPTASGKTALSIRLSKYLGAEIVSADSRQIYQELSIGTAKPSIQEREQALHHFIDFISIKTPYSAGDYERQVIPFLSEYFTRKKFAILVGGTGLYIKAVLKGLDDFPKIDAQIQLKNEELLQSKGLHFFQQILLKQDPLSYNEIDIQNPRRVLRAVNIIQSTGKPFSHFKKRTSKKRNFGHMAFYLSPNRQHLYQKINKRVKQMVENGLEEEVRNLVPFSHLKALDTVGYKEWIPYFKGDCDKAQVIEKIQQHSRNYAKRQLTWFRNQLQATPLNGYSVEENFNLLMNSQDFQAFLQPDQPSA